MLDNTLGIRHMATKSEYGISPHNFVTIWETSESVKEVCERLAVISEAAGCQPMPLPIVLARASLYRTKMKLPLKRMARVIKNSAIREKLLETIQKIKEGQKVEIETPVVDTTRTKPLNQDEVRAKVADLLAKRKKKKDK